MSDKLEFTLETMRLVCFALEAQAKAQIAESVKYPREYSTGVTSQELRMREVCTHQAEQYRDAIKRLRSMYDRHNTLRAKQPAKDRT